MEAWGDGEPIAEAPGQAGKLADASAEMLPGRLRDAMGDLLGVLEGKSEALSKPEIDAVDEDVGESEGLGVPEALQLADSEPAAALPEAKAVAEWRDAEANAEEVVEPENKGEDVSKSAGAALALGLVEAATGAVSREPVGEGDVEVAGEPLPEAHKEGVGVALPEVEAVAVALPEAEAVAVALL